MEELRDSGYDSEDSAEKDGEGDDFDAWGCGKADDAGSSCVNCQAINMLGVSGICVDVDVDVEAGAAHVLVSVMYVRPRRHAPPDVIARDPVRCDADHVGHVYMFVVLWLCVGELAL